MKELHFLVKGPALLKDPKSNFQNIRARSSKDYQLRFDFDGSWSGCKCAAEFEVNGVSHFAPIKDLCCLFPEEVVPYKKIRMRVIGVPEHGGEQIRTNWKNILQLGGA